MAELLRLVARQAAADGGSEETVQVPLTGTPGHCDPGNEYNGDMGLRISAIFVILVGSLLGAWFPIYAKRHAKGKIFEWLFFWAKYFGSGVIIATAFIHLLAPANEALTDPCLVGPITEYSWVEGIVLMTIIVLFFLELMTMRYADFGQNEHGHEHAPPHEHTSGHAHSRSSHDHLDLKTYHSSNPEESEGKISTAERPDFQTTQRGEDHLGHSRDHTDKDDVENAIANPNVYDKPFIPESYSAQMTAVFILEFGVIFHSIFIGLTLAVAGEEFITLYIVLVFHQSFEGLGLGTRLASAPWPKSKRLTPYILGAGYAISTPIATAVGLGIRTSFAPGSQRTLIVNGVFDSISAGILIYTGLVELMAHEFMFSPTMQRAKIQTVLAAFGMMCTGAGLMALLGKWA
ncbi:ZIP zinc/iron transport family [Venturia nashicola]|uniref:ZIP zinc/iron transport family n=1 Tax=Venturia nashicola TaxID=86259 RepID=A0A4Z1P256_9PEZI|nr:ZIP zinc/iron transport family [Venturia nashicola]